LALVIVLAMALFWQLHLLWQLHVLTIIIFMTNCTVTKSLSHFLSHSLSLSAKSHKKSSQTGEMLEMKKTMTRMRADMNGYKKEIVDKEKALTLYQQQEQKTENDHTETLTEMKRALSVKVR